MPRAGRFGPANLTQSVNDISSQASPPIQGGRLIALVGGQSAQPSLQFTKGKAVSLQPHDIILYY